ncbi:PREDICTED: protein spire isoform X7 [Dinoponera quadriceps]|uniref:Protein spire isoform X7 n=1 Tax=Dinoponera quadriceps TaxID=609295 RepID=A0A6P3Y143_DINQU|nr:PREDICTED: protein spire isoform X7 [Dinoponera quadriceps]
MSNPKKIPDPSQREPAMLDEQPQATVRKKGGDRVQPRCKLDSHGCLNLQDILLIFDSPVSQERAWALCYQTAKSLSGLTQNKFYEISEFSQIVLHKDGNVRLDNLAGSRQPLVSEDKAVLSLGMVIFKALDFGSNAEEEIALSPDLEALITLMTNCNRVAPEGDVEGRLQETDDEGIERDSGDTDADDDMMPKTAEPYTSSSVCTLKTVLQICARHVHEDADNYYQNVIQTFVEEALNLSQFLEKVVVDKQSQDFFNMNGTEHSSTSLQNLDALNFNDWTDVRIWRAIQARFWVQVIGELRRGVKLKKVEANMGSRAFSRGQGRSPDYKLTPYEILMDDIRERRYHLRKTPPTSSRKDAHAIILEFIRSRPPLKKASERRLRPLQKECTLRELLMESIKKPPKPLRSSCSRQSTVKIEKTSLYVTHNGEGTKEYEQSATPKPPGRNLDVSSAARRPKKVIPVDFDLKLDAEDDDDDDDDEYYNDEDFAETRFEEEDEASNYWHLKDYTFGGRGVRNGHKDHEQRDDDEAGSANPWRKTGGLRLTRNEYHRFCDAQLESYDLATQCPSRRASAKRHSAKCTIPLTSLTGTTSLPQSRPQSRQHAGLTDSSLSQGPSPNISLNPSPSLSPQPRARQPRRAYTIAEGKDEKPPAEEWEDDADRKATLGDMLLDERLSLTLDEIVHIRSVLTKAELESLPVEGRVKEDVEKRRVCFLCLKTRFGLLGPWGQRCRLCKRTVCVKCYSKMRIPTEQFARVPVVLLSPGLLLSPTETESSGGGGKSTWLRNSGAVGSAPASPASRRKDSAMRSGTPASTPTTTPVSALTPMSTPPCHARREVESQGMDKRCYKGSGSPAALSTTKTFSTSSGGPTAEQRMAAERLRGVAVVVCHDCRIMVIQIIKSSRTTRATIRNNVISRLTLNLSPAYV